MTTKAIVLAAGRGTRMMPLTADKPKAMIKVAGKPFIDHVLERLRDAGLDDVGVVVGYERKTLEKHLEQHHPGTATIHQNEPLGTGHAVACAEEFVDGDDFLVLMGDNLYSSRDIRWISSFAHNSIGALRVEDPYRYGVIETDGRLLKRITEKPDNPQTDLVNAALYRFTPDVFDALEEIERSPRGEYEITDAVTDLATGDSVFVYQLMDDWVDFGRPGDVAKVDAHITG